MSSPNTNIPKIATATPSSKCSSYEHACIIDMTFEQAIATLVGKKNKTDESENED